MLLGPNLIEESPDVGVVNHQELGQLGVVRLHDVVRPVRVVLRLAVNVPLLYGEAERHGAATAQVAAYYAD